MKTLYITRHAKSSWKTNTQDHLRPLNSRGKNDSILMANHIAKNCKTPQLIKTSDAKRALETAKQFKQAFNLADHCFEITAQLYDFSGENVTQLIENTPNEIDSLMIFGHNYGLTHLVNKWGNVYIDNLPTCGFVQIDFETNSWQNLKNGLTQKVIFPKQLKK